MFTIKEFKIRVSHFAKTLHLLLFLLLTLTTINHAQVDTDFDPAVGLTNADTDYVRGDMEIQPDGRIIVFGVSAFANISGISQNTVARLNADGTLDSTFNCSCDGFSYVNSVKVQTDGKIIIAGALGQFLTATPAIARLNADGTIDPTFTNQLTHPKGTTVAEIWGIQSDGKLLVATFGIGAFSPIVLKRLNTDGAIDESFNEISFLRSVS